MGTFHVSASILFTSSNYLHFHMNFFFPLFLPYLPFPTAQFTALEGVTKQKFCYLAPWQWKKEKKCNNLTGYSPAEPQPQAGVLMHYCSLQIYNSQVRSYSSGRQCKPSICLLQVLRAKQWDICSKLMQQGKNNCTAATVLLNGSQ